MHCHSAEARRTNRTLLRITNLIECQGNTAGENSALHPVPAAWANPLTLGSSRAHRHMAPTPTGLHRALRKRPVTLPRPSAILAASPPLPQTTSDLSHTDPRRGTVNKHLAILM
ncbi:hypothetical protein CgunFtcFv8_018514 [Champsocephalus gunnari]|uniref:Uncharacterized protein n=1 Tax=Champsocephalus gunnari TaxID=52237 RepID=A0AAN8BW54_CHAGU|nr:hypothetical protein CgunFtcFv8_018514 [Champsocephalus gunnari]